MNTQVSKIRQEPQQLTVLYIAAFGVNAVGLAAFDSYTNDPVFTLVSLFIIAAGFYFGWLNKIEPAQKNNSTKFIRYIVGIGLSIFLAAHVSARQILFLGTTESGGLTLAILISFIMIVISYYIISDEMLLFSCIPPLSLIGLTGTMGQDESIILYFSAYLVLASLLMIQQNLTANNDKRARQKHPLSIYAVIAATITIAAIVIGLIAFKVIYEPVDRRILSRLVVPLPFQNPTVQDINDYIPVGPSPSTSNEELMTVQTNNPILLRGQTFSYYTGALWRDRRPLMGQILSDDPGIIGIDQDFKMTVRSSFKIPQDKTAGLRKSVKKIKQLITITNGKFRIVFAPAEPEIVQFNDSFNLFNSSKMIGTSRFREAGSACKVESLVSDASPNELRKAGKSYPEDYKTWYLQIPPLEYDIKKLSDQICRGKRNPYDKAAAIQDYLEKYYTYDLLASMKQGEKDIVSDFLFNTKTGHCTLFASAMVMLSRHAGIPARLATGFNFGQYDEESGLYTITAANKHAWAELYFPNYGWITFDPSAASVNVSFKEKIIKALTNFSTYLRSKRTVIIVIAIIGLLAGYLLKTELFDKLKGKRKSSDGLAYISKAVANYRRMCTILGKFGFVKDPALTPLEYESRLNKQLDGKLIWLSSLVDAVTSDLITVRYADKPVPDERLNTNEGHLKKLMKDLKSARKKGAFTNIKEKVDGR
ncbi:MAG: transglutaminase domain-containing protein [Armatimonadota bacterium]